MSKPAAVSYTVTIVEYAYSGVRGAPLEWARCTGKGARQRAIECAEREFPARHSIISVTVRQVGGAHDGQIVWSRANPDAYMHAGETYCAAVYIRADRRIMAVYGVSRDTRETHAGPPSYREEELVAPAPLRGLATTFGEAVADAEHTRRMLARWG